VCILFMSRASIYASSDKPNGFAACRCLTEPAILCLIELLAEHNQRNRCISGKDLSRTKVNIGSISHCTTGRLCCAVGGGAGWLPTIGSSIAPFQGAGIFLWSLPGVALGFACA
jgi:hypothetical protein